MYSSSLIKINHDFQKRLHYINIYINIIVKKKLITSHQLLSNYDMMVAGPLLVGNRKGKTELYEGMIFMIGSI